MARLLVFPPLCRTVAGVLLGTALLTGCGPSGQCDGMVGGTRVHGDIDGDSTVAIVPRTFRPDDQSAHVRGALLQLNYGDGALKLMAEIKLPASQDTTELPLVLSQEEQAQRLPQDGMVALWLIKAPIEAPKTVGGTITVKLPDANNLEGQFDAQFEDGSRLECTYDLRGPNTVPGDDPTYNGPP